MLFKQLEKAYSSNKGGDYDPNLDVNTTKPQQEIVLKSISNWAKKQGYVYKRSLQSALFHMNWKDKVSGEPTFSIDGWHGSGKGNRNYGPTFMIHNVYGKSYKEHFRLSDTLNLDMDNRGTYFKSKAMKEEYLRNLERVNKAITSDNIESLWK